MYPRLLRQPVPLLLFEDPSAAVGMQFLEIQHYSLLFCFCHEDFFGSRNGSSNAHSRNLVSILQTGRLCCLCPALHTDPLGIK